MKPNPRIGTCPCPVKGCSLLMDVKRIKARNEDSTRQRKAGLLYADCPDHGRFGFDGAQAMQDYITENSTKCDDSGQDASAQAAPASAQEGNPAPAQPAAKPPALPPQKTALTSAQEAAKPPPLTSTQPKARGLLDW